MDWPKPVFDQVNVVAANLEKSADFYRRLGVSLPQPTLDHSGDPYHANGEAGGGLEFDLDSPALPSSGTRDGLGGRIWVGRVVSRLSPGLCVRPWTRSMTNTL
jgi:catechol 2,3-dioxygenase-like lactoylglutathione lyase family enzyme